MADELEKHKLGPPTPSPLPPLSLHSPSRPCRPTSFPATGTVLQLHRRGRCRAYSKAARIRRTGSGCCLRRSRLPQAAACGARQTSSRIAMSRRGRHAGAERLLFQRSAEAQRQKPVPRTRCPEPLRVDGAWTFQGACFQDWSIAHCPGQPSDRGFVYLMLRPEPGLSTLCDHGRRGIPRLLKRYPQDSVMKYFYNIVVYLLSWIQNDVVARSS